MNTGNDVTIKLGLDDAGLPAPVQRTNAAVASIGKTAEISARQTAAAMRTLPAQFTDIATQLAGGQNPLLILLQQGGQIKDSFGGISPALAALRAAITPTAAAVTGLGVGVGAAALAAVQGVEEFNAYRRAILLTGNEAGVTVGKLDALARAAAASVGGTRGNAADVAAQLAGAGDISRASLGPATEAAIALQRELRVEVSKTVSAFAELGKDPLKAAVSLNQQFNFLTQSTYAQIKSLTEQGRVAEAAAVAQQAYASAAISRSQEMAGSLGLLERGWRSVRDGAKEAWDAMLGLGRERTVEQELADVQARLAAPARRGVNPLQSDARRESLRQREAELQELLRLQQRGADLQATRAREAQVKAAADARAAAAGKGRQDREKPYIPGEFEVLDARDGQLLATRREKAESERQAFFDNVLLKDTERQAQRLTGEAGFLQQIFDANQRAAAELIENERQRGEALIALDLDIARRRIEAQGLSGGARDEALRLVDEQGALARRKLEVDLRQAGEKLADDTGRELYADTRDAISAAFRDSKNPIQAFGAALANTIFTRASASLVDALAAAAVGSNGRGGGLGSLIQLIGSMAGGYTNVGTPSAANYSVSPDLVGPPPLATGTNYVPRNMVALLHEGEAVVPKRYNPAAGGAGVGFQITNAPQITIDARTDQAQVAALVYGALEQSNTALVEDLQARGLIPS